MTVVSALSGISLLNVGDFRSVILCLFSLTNLKKNPKFVILWITSIEVRVFFIFFPIVLYFNK